MIRLRVFCLMNLLAAGAFGRSWVLMIALLHNIVGRERDVIYYILIPV